MRNNFIFAKEKNPQLLKRMRNSGLFNKTLMMMMLMTVFMWQCKKDDFKGETTGVCPEVISTDPASNATNVVTTKSATVVAAIKGITATFNEKMNASTINTETYLLKQGTNAISGTVTPTSGETATFTFTPASPLAPFTLYTATMKKGVKDPMNNMLQEDYNWSFTTQPEVSVASLPLLGGTASIDGSINQVKAFNVDASVTVKAVPSVGYVFANWTEGANVVSPDANYTFAIKGNRTLVANFTAQYAVTLSSLPLAGGTTTGGGTFNAGTSVTITAVPSVGYTFTNWTEAGITVSPLKEYTFPLTTARTLVANFAINMYSLNITSIPASGGTVATVPNQKTFSHGTNVQLTATPTTPGYTFVSWSGDATGTANPVTVNMNAEKNINANFTAIQYTVGVSTNPSTLVNKPTGGGTFNSGASVTVTAVANPEFTFTNWTEIGTNLSITTASYTFIISGPRTLVANYTANVSSYLVTALTNPSTLVNKPTGGGTFNSGASVTVTAVANPGFTFTNWTETGTNLSITTADYTFSISGPRTLVANYTADVIPPIGPAPINLGTAGDFTALTKSGISTTGVTSVAGDIGVSPAAATAITGFGLIMDINGQSSHTPIVTGKVYAADYAPPTPAKMTTAVSDMETAYTTGNNLVVPAPIVGLYAGDISGRTLPTGLYKWGSGVLITNAGVTLSGGANDVWIFQIAQNLTVENSAIVHLIGGAQAKNVFWIVAGQATIGTNADVSGIILSKTLISLNTGAKVTGKLLAQTAVTLNASTVVEP